MIADLAAAVASTPHPEATMPSTPSTSTSALTVPTGIDRADPAALARALLAVVPDHAVLLTVFAEGAVMTEPVDGATPIESMCGTTAPPQARMVGLAAPAMTTRRRDGHGREGHVVHLVDREGVSATALRDDGEITTFGPDRAPQSGRVPDACRRVLGLPTEPPDTTMTGFVFTAWLVVLSGRESTLDWRAAVALHPVAPSLPNDPTAAQVADATREMGEAMDWDRYRKVTAAIGGFPFGATGAAVAQWSDAGLFARWAVDELPDPADALHHLADRLAPDAIDRLWAVAHLCGAIAPDDETDDRP